MENTRGSGDAANIHPEDRELLEHWREYSYEDPNGGEPIKLTDRFSGAAYFAYGGVQFRVQHPRSNEPPWVMRCRNGKLSLRINLRPPPEARPGDLLSPDDIRWLPLGPDASEE
jgi:hypothetical protein